MLSFASNISVDLKIGTNIIRGRDVPKKPVAKEEVMHENSELTNHDCFANVFRERGFRKFSTAQIGKLLQEEYPNFSLGSILPNDHAKGDAASCWCVGTPQQIFNKVRRGFYRVRQYQH